MHARERFPHQPTCQVEGVPSQGAWKVRSSHKITPNENTSCRQGRVRGTRVCASSQAQLGRQSVHGAEPTLAWQGCSLGWSAAKLGRWWLTEENVWVSPASTSGASLHGDNTPPLAAERLFREQADSAWDSWHFSSPTSPHRVEHMPCPHCSPHCKQVQEVQLDLGRATCPTDVGWQQVGRGVGYMPLHQAHPPSGVGTSDTAPCAAVLYEFRQVEV
jgi:hypothetical protein